MHQVADVNEQLAEKAAVNLARSSACTAIPEHKLWIATSRTRCLLMRLCRLRGPQVAANAMRQIAEPMSTVERQLNARLLRQIVKLQAH